jgi:cytoskeletal protein CcmA (bactofilin family)
VTGGPIGSGSDLLAHTSDIESIYSAGSVVIDGEPADVDGDVVAMGTVEITHEHNVFGSVHSSAPAGARVGADVTGPATAIIMGDVVALGDVTLENVLSLSGSVRSDGDLVVSLDGNIFGDARANGRLRTPVRSRERQCPLFCLYRTWARV